MPNSRVADSTIKGFIYQFNKTILEILKSTTDTIHIEGIVEDIDIYSDDNSIKAIQCKYHESSETFKLSLIYKPIILMIKTFLERPSDKINFILFLYLPSETPRDEKLTLEQMEKILGTQTKDLKKIVESLDLKKLDKQKFIDQLIVRFDVSIDALEDQIKGQLETVEKFKALDVEGLLYPNLLAEIQRRSTIKEHELRKVTKQEIFNFLDRQSKVVINKWTLMTRSRKALLKTLRDDFRTEMNPNSLSRCFIFKGFNGEEVDRVAHFINLYVGKYLKKPSHKPASFVFDIEVEKFQELVRLLYDQNIELNDGMVGGIWKDNKFYKDCKIRRKPRNEINADFHIRAQTEKQEGFVIRDDFFHQKKTFGFIESELSFTPETIIINEFKEIEYLFSFRNEV